MCPARTATRLSIRFTANPKRIAMPTMPVDNIEKLAQSNEKVAHAMTIMAETLRDSQAEMGKAVNKMAIDVATIRVNSEHERSHRERLELAIRDTQDEISSMKHTIAEDGRSAAVSAFRGKVVWSAMATAIGAGFVTVWHMVIGKGG